MVTFCHSEENIDRVLFSSFKERLLDSFYWIIPKKIKLNAKSKHNQIRIDKGGSGTRVSCEFSGIFKNSFFYRIPPVVVSATRYLRHLR